jgi:hypothetical protein
MHMPDDEIEFLRTLGDDLRAAADHRAQSRWRDRRLLAITPVALVGIAVAAVLIVPSLVHSRATPHPLAGTHRPPPLSVPPALGGPPPAPAGPELNAVAATGPTDVWAVGDQYESGSPEPTSLILHFNGSSWSSVPTPNVTYLYGITALAPDDAWAVSPYGKIVHWNGSSWSLMTLPNVPGMQISAISGSGPDDVWIVGNRYGAKLPADSIGSHTLTEHWDGSRWSVVTSPNPSHARNGLDGVLSLSPTDAWAVGYAKSRLTSQLTMHWDGTRWTTVPTPTRPGRYTAELDSVGSDGQGGVWAVGRGDGPGYGASLYLRWTGTRWVKVRGPGPMEQTPPASAISGSSPTDLWAVGNPCCGRYVVARYTGAAWHDQAVSFPAGVQQFEVTLDDVATLSPTDAWAVGSANAPEPNSKPGTSPREIVILHWDGTSWQPTAVPGIANITAG